MIGRRLKPVINVAEPEGSLDFSFCDSLQMNHDWIADLTEEAQSSDISNDLFSLEDLFSDMINEIIKFMQFDEETRLGNQFGAVHTILMCRCIIAAYQYNGADGVSRCSRGYGSGT